MALLRILFNRYSGFAILALILILYFCTRDIYDVTGYSNHPISINKKEFLDYRFASNKKTYFGGVAARKGIPFGSEVELIPLTPDDEKAIKKYLRGRTKFTVEDRGYLVKGKVIDIFFPRWLGGHKTAKRWGRRKMKIKITLPEELKKRAKAESAQ